MSAEGCLAAGALIVAIGTFLIGRRDSARSTGETTKLQQRLTDIEEARRLDEQRPDIGIEYQRLDAGVSLRLRNLGPIDLDAVHLETVEHPAIVVEYQHVDIGSFLSGDLGPLRLGESRDVLVVENRSAVGGELQLRISCQAGNRRWQLHRACQVKGYPRAF